MSTRPTSYQLRKWSILVRWRDRKCMICGSREKLEAHHLADKTYHPELVLDLNNGIALCNGNKKGGSACHMLFHTKFRGSYRMKCTKEQFEKFAIIARQYLNVPPK